MTGAMQTCRREATVGLFKWKGRILWECLQPHNLYYSSTRITIVIVFNLLLCLILNWTLSQVCNYIKNIYLGFSTREEKGVPLNIHSVLEIVGELKHFPLTLVCFVVSYLTVNIALSVAIVKSNVYLCFIFSHMRQILKWI